MESENWIFVGWRKISDDASVVISSDFLGGSWPTFSEAWRSIGRTSQRRREFDDFIEGWRNVSVFFQIINNIDYEQRGK